MKPHFSRLPGGRYTARQNEDGTWDVMDVPIFSVIPKGVKGAPKDIVEEDLRSAVNNHRKKFSEDKFLARTNVLHNYSIHRPTPAGFFLPTDVRPFRMGGKTRPTVFADLLSVPNTVFRMIERDELPYLSPEVRTYEPLIFGALALLDTEPPFFEFPLVSIGQKQEAEVVRIDDEGGPALAVATAGTTSAFLFSFKEDDMPEDVEKKDVEEEQMADDGGGLKEAVAAIEAQMKELQPVLELLPKLQEMMSTATEPEEATEELADEPVSVMSADTEEKGDEATKMEARVAALEDYRDQNTKEKAVNAIFADTVKSLEDEGYALSEKTKERLFAAAEKGEETLKLFSDTYRDTAPKDPPAELDGIPSGEAEWPAEVMQYAQKSPELFANAKQAYRDWKELDASPAFSRGLSKLDVYLKREVG